jgi:hypothetical protein
LAAATTNAAARPSEKKTREPWEVLVAGQT